MNKAEVCHAELKIRLSEEKQKFVCLLQEPYTYKNKLVGCPSNAKLFPTQTVNHRPRAALLIHTSITATELPQLQTRDIACVMAVVDKKRMILCSTYFDITNRAVIPEGLARVVGYADENKLPLIIGADTNSHSILFGPDSNRRGDILDEFIASKDLQIENLGHQPTFQTQRARSCIDVTFSKRTGGWIKDWRVDKDFNGSDHHTILFNLGTGFESVPTHRPWDKANWALFRSELEGASFYFPDSMTDKKIDRLCSKVYSVIGRALDKSCPKIPQFARDPQNKWYTESLSTFRSRVHDAHKKARSRPTPSNTKSARDLSRKYLSLIHI